MPTSGSPPAEQQRVPGRRAARPARGCARRRSRPSRSSRRSARTALRRERHVRDGAVRRDADGAPERDEAAPAARRRCGRAPRCSRRESASSGSNGARIRGSWPPRSSSRGERLDVAGDPAGVRPRVRREQRDPHRRTLPAEPAASDGTRGSHAIRGGHARAAIIAGVSARHFVKYTFLKLDPAWRRLDAERARAGQARADGRVRGLRRRPPAAGVLARGTRGDAELMLLAEAENLERIHEFHVVLAQSGLMKWAEIPYSFLGMRKSSEYSEDERTVPRGFRGRYVFVYPFVKSREWYALPARSAGGSCRGTSRSGANTRASTTTRPTRSGSTTRSSWSRSTPTTSARSSTSCSACARPRPRATRCATRRASRASAMSLERALNALDGEPVALATGAVGARGLPARAREPQPAAASRLRAAEPGAGDELHRSDAGPAGHDRVASGPRPTATITTARSCARSSASSCRCARRARSTAG